MACAMETTQLQDEFEDMELMSNTFYQFPKMEMVAEIKRFRCTCCDGLMITAYKNNCGHLFCGKCARTFVNLPQPKDLCPFPNCTEILDGSKLEHGANEDVIEHLVNKTRIYCPWKCQITMLAKEANTHWLECPNSGIPHPTPAQPLHVTTENTNVISKELNEIKGKFKSYLDQLKAGKTSVSQTIGNLKLELAKATDKDRTKAMIVEFNSEWTNHIGSRDWRSMTKAERDSIESVVANIHPNRVAPSTRVVLSQSTWEVDLEPLMEGASSYPGVDCPKKWSKRYIRTNEMKLEFIINATLVRRSESSPPVLYSFVMWSTIDVTKKLLKWPLSATAIMKVTAGNITVAGGMDIQSELDNMFYFPDISMSKFCICEPPDYKTTFRYKSVKVNVVIVNNPV